MRLASEQELAPAVARFDEVRGRLTGYNAGMLDHPTAGPSLQSYVLLTECAELLAGTRLTAEELYWSRYYWLLRFSKTWSALYGRDAGLEQQMFQLLDQAPADFRDPMSEVADAVDWDLCRATSPAFADQVETLIALGYPTLLGLEPRRFRQRLAHLASEVGDARPSPSPEDGTIPFVLVVPRARRRSEALSQVWRRQKQAVERLHPKSADDFEPIEGLDLPNGDAYLLIDVDRGHETLDMTPNDAMPRIRERRRQPLTIEEGIAILTQYPDFLQPNNCFYMLGSRCGDKRVPALWLSEGRPKLGWCWAGNPHTWLGSASCAGRTHGLWLRETGR